MSCPCTLVTLIPDSPVLLVLPEEPFCCCEEPIPVIPGIFYDGDFFFDGEAIFNSVLAP